MRLHKTKLLYVLFTLFILIGCKENTDTPPFIFNCKVKLINEDGSSPLQENKDKINQITVNLLSPINKDTQITDISYLTYYNCLNIQVLNGKPVSKTRVIMNKSIF